MRSGKKTVPLCEGRIEADLVHDYPTGVLVFRLAYVPSEEQGLGTSACLHD